MRPPLKNALQPIKDCAPHTRHSPIFFTYNSSHQSAWPRMANQSLPSTSKVQTLTFRLDDPSSSTSTSSKTCSTSCAPSQFPRTLNRSSLKNRCNCIRNKQSSQVQYKSRFYAAKKVKKTNSMKMMFTCCHLVVSMEYSISSTNKIRRHEQEILYRQL